MLQDSPLEISYDNLVIGCSLEAVMFAFYNKIKIIHTRPLIPDIADNIKDYGLGTNRKNIWQKHVLQLSLAGYVPFENKIKYIRYVDINTLKLITFEENTYIIKFNKLYVFDDYNFLDLPISISRTSDEIRVLDWFKLARGSVYGLESIQSKSKFINQIIFYKNIKNKFNDVNDICVVSYFKKKELDKYPEHLVKIKTEAAIEQHSIANKKNINISISLEHIERQTIDLGKDIYEDFDNALFVYTDEKLMYDFHRTWVKIDYMKYLRMKLGIANDRDE